MPSSSFLGVVGGGRGVLGGGLVRSRGGVAVSALGLLGVGGDALVADVGDVAILVIGGVSHNLDTTVGEVDTVAAGNIAIGILVLSLIKAGARVGVLDAVLVLIGLGRELLLLVGGGFVVGGGGSIGRGSMVWPGGGGGNGHEGTESDEALQWKKAPIRRALGREGDTLIMKCQGWGSSFSKGTKFLF